MLLVKKSKGEPFMAVYYLLATRPTDTVGCRLCAVLEDSVAPCADLFDRCFFSEFLSHGRFPIRALPDNTITHFQMVRVAESL